jgi:hypothetical protein
MKWPSADAAGNLYIYTGGDSRVTKFAPGGQLLTRWDVLGPDGKPLTEGSALRLATLNWLSCVHSFQSQTRGIAHHTKALPEAPRRPAAPVGGDAKDDAFRVPGRGREIEDNLVGLSVGDKKFFDITFPLIARFDVIRVAGAASLSPRHVTPWNSRLL